MYLAQNSTIDAHCKPIAALSSVEDFARGQSLGVETHFPHNGPETRLGQGLLGQWSNAYAHTKLLLGTWEVGYRQQQSLPASCGAHD